MENLGNIAEGQIGRALRVISRARILSTLEFLDLHSVLHFRIDFRVLSNMKRSLLRELIVTVKQPDPTKMGVTPGLSTNEPIHWMHEKLPLN